MFKKENPRQKLVLGLVHLLPLPGTPLYTEGGLARAQEKVKRDVAALVEGGAQGCLVQSVDKIYPSTDDTDYARVAGMALLVETARQTAGPDFYIGAQLMWNCITPSLAVAKVCGADFTRCSVLVGQSLSPFGMIEADPLKVMSYRRKISAQDVAMIAEISGYHFLQNGAYDPAALVAMAKNAVTVGADAIEVFNPDPKLNDQMVTDLKAALPGVPVILGGGTNVANVSQRLALADGALVGSCFENGQWGGPICADTVRAYMEQVRLLGGDAPPSAV